MDSRKLMERMKKSGNFKTDKPCVSCGLVGENMVCLHHVYSKKAYPEYKFCVWNLMPLCFSDHEKIHRKPLIETTKENKRIESWLINNHWYICEFTNKWRHHDVHNDIN